MNVYFFFVFCGVFVVIVFVSDFQDQIDKFVEDLFCVKEEIVKFKEWIDVVCFVEYEIFGRFGIK